MKNRCLFILLISILFTPIAKAQVGFGIKTPDLSAVVELSSSNKGLLIPRINLTNLASATTPILNPANGLIVYNTNTTTGQGLYYYSTPILNRWVKIFDIVNAWNLSGNQNTVPGTNFIGTTDNQDVVFKRNNIISGRLNAQRNNTSFGLKSLSSINAGSGLVAIGYEALFNNKDGNGSIAYGNQALRDGINGSFNMALGNQSLFKTTTGSELNIGIGNSALFLNTTGSHNTAIGKNSLYNNTTVGYNNGNIGIGNAALQNNVIGTNNIAIGNEALSQNLSNQNIGIGIKSLSAQVTSQYNLAIGNYSLQNNTSGTINVALGTYALYNNKIGFYNNAIGYNSLYNSVNNFNIAIGNSAALNLTTGSTNIALGANTNLASPNLGYQLNISNYIFGTGLSASYTNPNPASGNGSIASIGIGQNIPKATLHVEGSLATDIKANSAITNAGFLSEYTVLVSSNLNLPTADASNNGRIYYLINDNGGTHIITATSSKFRTNSTSTANYTLDATVGKKGIMIQSYAADSEWIILAKY
jgi:hypothetical protein